MIGFLHPHTYLGATGPLRMIRDLTAIRHRQEMQKAHEAPLEEKHQHYENASRWRDMVDKSDMAMLLARVGAGR